jgi:hypothetical protein
MRSNDRWLEQRLLVHLINHGIGPDVVVVADDWHVTLSGDVASEEARHHAAELARTFPGVTQVKNELNVRDDGASASPDTRMQESAAASRTGQPDSPAGVQSLRAHPGGLIEPRWLIGRPVLDDANRRIGTVSHIWAEPTSGEIQELIVSSGDRNHRFIAWDDVDVVWDAQRPLLKVRGN